MTENKKTFVAEHSGLGITTTNLVPASLPEENKIAKVVVNMCQFGLRLDVNRINFIKFFKQEMQKNKALWGESDEQVNNDVVSKRERLLIRLVNNYLKKVKPKHTIPELKLVSVFNSPYEASYGWEYHDMTFGLKLTGKGFSKLNQAHVARVLYHEMRHADQTLLATRFMLARGQDPASKQVFPEMITAAVEMDKLDLVQEGTDGKVIKEHRHYHCAIRLYASMFGDVEEEETMTPNIYEEEPYKVPAMYRQEQRSIVGDKIEAQKTVYLERLEADVQDAKYVVETISGWMRKYEDTKGKAGDYIDEKMENLSAPYNKKNADYQDRLYKEFLWEEKDAYETADPILEEYGSYV